MGISPDGYDVLPGRQVATVVCALGKGSQVFAINRDDKAQILPKICNPVNEQTG
jgi:hypothetical protein